MSFCLPYSSQTAVLPTDNIRLIGNYFTDNADNVCISWLAIVSMFLLFGVLQILILAVYCFMYYRKRQKNTDQVSLDHDFQPRHVTWADQ